MDIGEHPDPSVRRNAFHGIIDGLPRHLTPRAADVLEAMREDPDPKLRRGVRKVLARYRRTGEGVIFGQNVIHLNHGTIRVGDTVTVSE